MTTVDDPTLLATMFVLWERLKMIVEPTDALSGTAVLHGSFQTVGTRVGVILSEGNVEWSQVPR